MASPTSNSNAEVAGRSLRETDQQQLEACLFPAFDLGEAQDDQNSFLSVESRLALHVHHDSATQVDSVLCAAWGFLLGWFTGLENVCFAFDSQGSTTSSGRREGAAVTVAQLHTDPDRTVQTLLAESISGLSSLSHKNRATQLFNTRLSIRSLPPRLSRAGEVGQQQESPSSSSPSSSSSSPTTSTITLEDVTSWCQINLTVDPVSLETTLSWRPAMMTRDQAINVHSTFEKIVGEILAHPDAKLLSLDCFSERNLHQVLAYNSAPMSQVQKCVHQAICEQGSLRPDAEAVCAWDGSLSYSQLTSLSNRLAYRLKASGVGPEVFVPICFDKSRWTIVAVLAVLKAGGIFVPLDPTHPVPRLQALTLKVGAQTLLCSRHHLGMLETVAKELIAVDDQFFAELPQQQSEDVVNDGSYENGAYMIFTSGTTGEPKGALIQHGAIMSSAMAHGPAMLMDHNTRSLQFAASTFDVSITEILTCLVLGGCVCVPSEEARLNSIEEAITELRVNWALLTPTFVKFINPDNVPTLKTLVTGGEAMTQAIIRSWGHINLTNCYGPAETSVVSHVHRGMKDGKNPLNIGNQVGIRCWVTDRWNHDRLVPVGAIGELIIEGFTLAREYYQEAEKTNEAFILDPLWTKNQPPSTTGPRRMYKTGDLVKYNHDGTFHIAGRKDTQIKFHGQRIELGEIEHHLNVSPSIKHGMVVLPKEGFCKGRLLAMVQLSDALNQDLVPKGRPYHLIEGLLEEAAKDKVAEAKKLLTERLPPYMIPSMWLPVEFIPRLQSGKLDRKQTGRWIDEMSEALFRQLNPVAASNFSEDMTRASKTELELHEVWRHVLNLKSEQLGLRQSFLSVGGDSISAMQVMSECRKRGFGLTVAHIIGSKSISALALHVKDIETPLFHKEILEQNFELSPIQNLFFARPNNLRGHYNQSFLLKASQRILLSEMRTAIERVIQRHSMLRARFSQNSEGQWQQRVTNEVASSFRLRSFSLDARDQVDRSLNDSQTCLNPTDGPLLAADLIDVNNGEEELVFIVIHHLVIDLVSWRVILQELEELLLRPEAALKDAESPLPFQTWCKMQMEHVESRTTAQVLPVEGIPDGNSEYWGMDSRENIYGQMTREGFEIGPALTTLLLSKCHEALRTEIPDLLLAAMVYSFGQTFTDRSIPAIFAEGHGREVWDPSINLSNVVGWFTTIYPVYAGAIASEADLVDTVKLVKDGKRKVPDMGRPYFASRWLTEAGKDAFSKHWPLEITFNYLGQYQQLERQDALFTPASDIAGEVKSATDGADVGPFSTCISFFEVSAVILKGCLRFSFVFNKNMNHQPKIRQWIQTCEQSLGAMLEQLSERTPEPTLSDFPLLDLTYDRLALLTDEKLPEAGVASVDLIEDAYPCSPMQSGLLVSTTKSDAFYAAYTLHEVVSRTNGKSIDTERLASAWRQLVEYHPILRTIFVESVAQQESLYDQVVLKEVSVPMIVSEKETDEEAIEALSAPPLHQRDNDHILHHFEICTSKSGKVFCRLDISHVIMDGTSMSIVFRDLALAYEGNLGSVEPPLYRNYIKYLEEQPTQPGIDYWANYLSGLEPCHFPVLDDGNAAEEEKKLQYLRIKFEELKALQKLCGEQGVTIVNAIYAAWALTLRLYTASEEVCFGYLTSARDSPIHGIRDVVGPVINMVVCRVNFSDPATTLQSVMSTVQRDYLESLPHRHIALAEVQHALKLSGTDLFNTALSYRKLPPPEQNPPDISFEECRPTYDPDEYNVSINIEAGEEDMAVDLTYWNDTLSHGQAANIASTFVKALSNILHYCAEPVVKLDHLGDLHHQQVTKWNAQMPAAVETCVHDLFHQQVLRDPTAPAIASWDMSFTYEELDLASTQLAHHLVGLGVNIESFVLVCFPKSACTLVSMLAILKAGGVCVPLDPAHPDVALKLRADDTGASIALVDPSLVERFTGLVKQTVAVDVELIKTLPLLNPDASSALPQASPHNACFVIYTSGSTGRPKGVILEHRGLATNCEASGVTLGYEKSSRVLQFASYTFDNSLAEIFNTLTRGGCVCVPSEFERMNDLAGVINRLQVTMVDITPTVACFLQPSDVPTLKIMALGGEAVTAKCVDIWRDYVALKACYGPSECSVNSAYSGDIALPGKATNIGRAIGCLAWVVEANNHNHLAPVGCAGELLIDGPIVTRGYLNLPEKTEQAFIAPPAWLSERGVANPNRRLYKTGDLVRYDSDGTLMYLGRKDTQVKLNGQRIELGEIEYHIEQNLSQEGAQSAVELIAVGGTKALAGFICATADASVRQTDDSDILPMSDDFRAEAKRLEVILATKIPAYMVPSVWLPIAKMPMTISGKLDRRGLRLQGGAVPVSSLSSYKLAIKSGRAPESDMEKQLAEIWASVLSVEASSIGVEDNFFKLGGDSIGAMRLVTLARKAEINFTVASIFQKTTLFDLAESALPMSKGANSSNTAVQPFSLLSEETDVKALKQEVSELARIRPHEIQDMYPCTAIQEGLMALSNKEAGAYVAQLVYHLPSDVQVLHFKAAWNKVVKSESTLRTRVVHTESLGFVQLVINQSPRWTTVSSLADLDPAQRLLPVHNGGSLSNYTMVEEGVNTYFVWTIHHSLYDGWCLPVILEKVKACYEQLVLAAPVGQLTSGPAYSTFVKYLTELDTDKTDDFWRLRLSDVSAQQFPRLPNPEYQANASSLMIHKAPLSRTVGSEITIATRIRAAWALTVSAYSAANDVIFWETVTGRDVPVTGVEDMIGATLATVPRRMELESATTVQDFLRIVQDQTVAAMSHQFAGIHRIKHLNTDTVIACGAQNLIAINNGARESDDASGFWSEYNHNEMAGTNFYTYPMMLSCHIDEAALETVVHFDSQVVSEQQMQRIMDHFALMLSSVSSVETGREQLGSLSLLSARDCETLQRWNGVMPPPIDRLVHEMIKEKGAAQEQDKQAVCSWDAQLSHSELDSLSTRLASILVENGISEGSIVPFCLEKSSLVLVSIMAILKSGAAFVPLDPAHPDARMRDILADVEASVVLCSPQYTDRLATFGPKAISVSRAFIDDLSESESMSMPTVSTNSPAYVIFTSGTTGKPKGTVVGHSAFCTGASAHGAAMGMCESSRVLQFASYTFDASVMEMLSTLIKGGTVCIPSDEERINDIAGAINRMKVNWALLTPSVAQLFQPSSVPGLTTLVLGGEGMSSAHIKTWGTSPTVQLMNAYGPSETAVVATVNNKVTLECGPADIGLAVGGLCWVTDANNHNRLMPIGAIGELVVEGPILAHGYLKNPQKTADAFITNPTWCGQMSHVNTTAERKMYKTGDLVKLTEDGSIVFQGRKDNQVKINGQRLELSEVEHHVGADPAVYHGMVAIPSSGPMKKRLVAIVSLKSLTEQFVGKPNDKVQLVGKDAFTAHLPGIRERSTRYLAAYMVPSYWLVVEHIPLLPSGKLDRRLIVGWAESMTEEQHQTVLQVDADASGLDRDANDIELKLREAWAKVLRLDVDKVPFTQSFFRLGGDSISAMQLMAACRSSDIVLTVGQIMKSKSIVELATLARSVDANAAIQDVEQIEKLFELSPIQKMYFESMDEKSGQFNQSMLLGTTHKINSEELDNALRIIIETHSMLRARFSVRDGIWSQRITNDVAGSFRLRMHEDVEQASLSSLVEESQQFLDCVHGPLFAADIFEIKESGEQVVTFAAHHLVIDVVSWHIILQDLEELMSGSAETLTKQSLSFQTWSALQLQQAQETTMSNVFHSIPLPPASMSYWDMKGVANVNGDAVTESFTINAEQSKLLLGSCHDAFQTDVADILIASLLWSFRQTFADRPRVPSVFNEGHGREPWEDKLDLSRTVGWFTTLCPVYLPESIPTESTIVDVIQWVKDFRRKVPGKGRPYFAHSMLSQAGREQSQLEWPVEIAFNFLGQSQESKQEKNAVFKSVGGSLMDGVNSATDIGVNVPRLALIEISASFVEGCLNVSFSSNRRMKRKATSVRSWMNACEVNIGEAVTTLCAAKPAPTMADYPLLPLSFNGVSQIQEKLSQVNIASLDDIEDAYPCSPVQQGILFAQIKNPACYAYSVTFEPKHTQSDDPVDVVRLANAWQAVVDRHSSLRTIFLGSLLHDEEGTMDQVVLKDHPTTLSYVKCKLEEVPEKLKAQSSLGLPIEKPPHHLKMFNTPEGRLFCVLEMSHAIADGTSMPVLFRDLGLAYTESLPKPTLSVYRDYVAHLRQAEAASKAMSYWKNYLNGIEACHLPTMAPGATDTRVLKAMDQNITLHSQLDAFCADNGVTLSNVLQLAWALVLQAYTGLDDVCFGYLVSGRDVPVENINEAIGVFINMLICRVVLNPATSITDTLQGVQTNLMESMQHKQISLADVQHEMGTANAALFNTAYSFQRRSVSKSMTTGPIEFDITDAQDPSEYDLTVNVEVWDTKAEIQLCYWSDKISDWQAKNMASTLDMVLTSLISQDANMKVGEMTVLSEHCNTQLTSWNHAEPAYEPQCVHHVFESNAEQRPAQTPAIDAWDASFTYQELDAVAAQLAEHLISLGVKAETYVPLCFEKSAWTIVSMIAVLKAGGAFVPLDPTYPPERIAYLLESVDAQLILCSPSLTAKFANSGAHVLPIGQQSVMSLPKPSADVLAAVSVTPDNPAYIIFTSGTTGLPKGTVIEHGAFVKGGTAHAKAIKMTSTSRVLQFASHTFDASIMEILSTLLVGGCICVPSDQDRLNDLVTVIDKFQIDWTLLTPSVASVLKPSSVPGLKVLVTGGEAMSSDHIIKWSNTGVALINAYGPSETSVIATTSTKVDETGKILNREPANIGHAVGSRIWVVDPRNHNRLMPIGSTGELLVEGPIVARGYLRNEAKTKEAFITHPAWRSNMDLAGDRQDRMYKTGDLVFYNPDGSVTYIARKDIQIKLNGQRIELGEIEHHVKANLPTDFQSAVDLVVPQSKNSTKALAVFFTCEEYEKAAGEVDGLVLPMTTATTKLAKSLKTALGGAIPSYMVPTIYIPVTKMPWTSSGKLDRAKLKVVVSRITTQQIGAYKLFGAASDQKRLPPTTHMQRKLEKVWRKVLNLAANVISREDSFFRLGGDSVVSMKLVAAARVEGILVTVQDVFKHPKLSDMASCAILIGEAAGPTIVKPFSLLRGVESPNMLIDEIANLCRVSRGEIQDAYPCSSLQEGLITSSLHQPGAYVAQNVFELPKDVDLDRFKSAWQKTVDEVDILRSRVVNTQSSKSYQVILQPHSIAWNTSGTLDQATSGAPSLPERNGAELAHYSIVESVDSGAVYFVWTVHHSLYDAWSMPAMLKLVSQFYFDENAGDMALSVPFANFVKYLEDIDAQASNKFWMSKFDNCSPTHFPAVTTMATSESEAATASMRHTIAYNRSSMSETDLTVPTLVRAAWTLVVGAQSGSDDVVFGETLSGRDISLLDVGSIHGPTLATVPIRVEIDREMTVVRFLETLHDNAAEVIPFQHAGLQNIKRLGPSISIACDFSNLLVIQAGGEAEGEQDPLLRPLEAEQEQKSFFTYPLVVECAIQGQNLDLTIHHDENIITSWQVKRMVHQFDALIQQLTEAVQKPTEKVAELRLYSHQDVEMLREWNDTSFQKYWDSNESIPSNFYDVVERTPKADAIASWDGELNYEDTKQHAVRLARWLKTKGVGPEVFVPCCMDKTLWTSVSMLAIMLAGGCIIPFDAAHPPARHAEIIQDCKAQIVLCSPQHEDRFKGVVETIVLVDPSLFTTTLPRLEQEAGVIPAPLPAVNGEDAAFIIYTSGSTGKPKGVVIDHRSFCASSKAFLKRMNVTAASRMFHFTSYAFDIAMGETFGALTTGACLCVPNEERRVADLPGAMNDLGATWAFLTPSVANIQDATLFKTMRTLVCGGEALTPETIVTWSDHVELMNGYGPAECTVFAVANDKVASERDHTKIGSAMDANHTWVVDPRDHNYLVSIGCVGELLIEGPIVARGYLHDKEKTAASFVENPGWAHWFTSADQTMRLYKTGDLVKYRPDGSLTYMGRSDNQVKLHGQRMEVGEIEAHLESDKRIRHSIVGLPKTGICKGRLVAVVTLHDLMGDNEAALMATKAKNKFNALSSSLMELAKSQVSQIQEALGVFLPPYMIPSSWLVVEEIPLLVSGKLDRKSAQAWLATMSTEDYNTVACADNSAEVAEPETSSGKILRQVWSTVLRIEEETMPINRSFINLGGDSITAIQVMTRCRDQGIRLTLQEVLKSKSITDLGDLIDREERRSSNDDSDNFEEEQVNQSFALSPVQQLFFNNSANKETGDRFNQSQTLSLSRHVEANRFKLAIEALVQRHSMLRARFSKAADGQWTQLILPETSTASYSFQHHMVEDDPDMIPFIASSQNSISINGPVFAVDLFEFPDQSQVVSLIAHHLVIDVVSWLNIIQLLETHLTSINPPAKSAAKVFSFQAWNAVQTGHAQSLERRGDNMLSFPLQPAQFDFWGMAHNASNTYGDVIRKSFTISDPKTVSLALGDSHKALRTEPLDLFVSALLQSFRTTFGERDIPTLFNEGHGREAWDHTVDVSQIVGWFTALSPVCVKADKSDDLVDFVRQVKDVRRSVPSNGRPYFAHRYLTDSGKRDFAHHESMELLLNYLSRTQQTGGGSQSDSLLQAFDMPMNKEEADLTADVAPETQRLALFEISVSIVNDGISFVFMYNKHMLHQDRIATWISGCEQVLVDTVRELSLSGPVATLSDYPLLPINHFQLHKLVSKSLPAARVGGFADVEDIFPCSPMQTGMLLSQQIRPERYLFNTVLEVNPTDAATIIDPIRLSEACAAVVNRHAALRTVFVNSVYSGGSFDQVVLKPQKNSRIKVIKCREIEVMAKLNTRSLEKVNRKTSTPALPYLFTICQTVQGKTFIKVEMNHAITDGASTSIILQDIVNAYSDRLATTEALTYKEYIKYISSQSMQTSLNFWTGYLSGAESTYFPTINNDTSAERSLGSIEIDFRRWPQLHALSADAGVTFSNIVLASWALILRSYTKSEDVCFGYLASGRDARIDGIDQIVGPFINMLVFRFRFAPGMLLKNLFQDAQEDFLASLPHQHFSLAQLNHALGRKNGGFFNTAVSIQNAGAASGEVTTDAFTYESVDAHDPSEFAITLNVNTTQGDEGIMFRYWTDVMSENQADGLALLMSNLLDDFIDHRKEALSHLRIFQTAQSPTPAQTPFPQTPYESDWSSQDGEMSSGNTTLNSDEKSSTNNMDAPHVKKLVNLSHVRASLTEKLTSLWLDNFDVDDGKVSEEDSFFELGGDSIVAMAMVGSARETGLQLNVADIFKNPTFGELLDCLMERSAEDNDYQSTSGDEAYFSQKGSSTAKVDEPYEPFSLLVEKDTEKFLRETVCTAIGVSRASIVDVLPTTDFQAQAVEGALLDSRWMLNHFYLDGEGALDINLLRESIDNVVASFDILRTVFIPYKDTFLQAVLRRVYPEVVIEDVMDIDQYTSTIEEQSRGEAQAPRFGKSYLRFTIVKQASSNRHRIFIRISHAQYDGVCFPAILEALQACYEGEPIAPTPPYSAFIRNALGKVTPDHYSYWRSLLQNSTPSDVIQRDRTGLKTFPTEVIKKTISARSLASLNITTATVIKAAWYTVLTKVTGKSDIVFGHLINGRSIDGVLGIESIVGPCINLVPVRIRSQANWTVLNLLRNIQEQQVDSMPYETLGFREVIGKCTGWEGYRGDSGFSTMVQHQSMSQTGGLEIGGNEYTVGVVAPQEDTVDFSVVTTPQDGDGLEVCLIYANDGTVQVSEAQQMFDSLCMIIQRFTEDPYAIHAHA